MHLNGNFASMNGTSGPESACCMGLDNGAAHLRCKKLYNGYNCLAACAGSRLIFKDPLEQKNGVHHTLGSVAVQLGTKTWGCGATAWNPLDPPWNRAAEARGMDQALQF